MDSTVLKHCLLYFLLQLKALKYPCALGLWDGACSFNRSPQARRAGHVPPYATCWEKTLKKQKWSSPHKREHWITTVIFKGKKEVNLYLHTKGVHYMTFKQRMVSICFMRSIQPSLVEKTLQEGSWQFLFPVVTDHEVSHILLLLYIHPSSHKGNNGAVSLRIRPEPRPKSPLQNPSCKVRLLLPIFNAIKALEGHAVWADVFPH